MDQHEFGLDTLDDIFLRYLGDSVQSLQSAIEFINAIQDGVGLVQYFASWEAINICLSCLTFEFKYQFHGMNSKESINNGTGIIGDGGADLNTYITGDLGVHDS